MDVEVTTVSRHGFWLLIDEIERFVPFKDFPWFRDASIAELMKVELPSPDHLYWPDLDVDLAVDSLDHPERYPLVSRVPTSKRRPSAVRTLKEPRRSYNRRPRRP